MSNQDKWRPQPPPTSGTSASLHRPPNSTQPRLTYSRHQYSRSTNADPRLNSSSSGSREGGSGDNSSQRRHSEQYGTAGSGALLAGSRGEEEGSRVDKARTRTNSSGWDRQTGLSKAQLNVYSHSSVSQKRSRPSTGPVKAPPGREVTTRERSQSVDSDDETRHIEFEDGKMGRMRDVGDDEVLISLKSKVCMYSNYNNFMK